MRVSSMLLLLALVGCAMASRYVPPTVKALFVETFQGETTHPSINWVPSKNEKYTGAPVCGGVLLCCVSAPAPTRGGRLATWYHRATM